VRARYFDLLMQDGKHFYILATGMQMLSYVEWLDHSCGCVVASILEVTSPIAVYMLQNDLGEVKAIDLTRNLRLR